MAEEGQAAVEGSVRRLVGQLTAPTRLSAVVRAWMAPLSTTDPAAKPARLALLLHARRVLKVPASPGAEEQRWWGTPERTRHEPSSPRGALLAPGRLPPP